MGFQFSQLGILDNFPKNIHIEVNGITIRQFVEHLEKIYSWDIAAEILDERRGLKTGLVFILNGKNIFDLNGLDTFIPSGSLLILSAEILGG